MLGGSGNRKEEKESCSGQRQGRKNTDLNQLLRL